MSKRNLLKTQLSLVLVLITLLASLTSCKTESEGEASSNEQAPTQPSNPQPGSSGLQSNYCMSNFIELSASNSQYELKISELSQAPIAMSGTYENGLLSLTGQVNGVDLMFIGMTVPDGSFMSTNLMVLSNGLPVHSIKSLGTAGTCSTIEISNLPKIAQTPVDLNYISRISRFRSSSGHNFSDYSESCRSLKHYFDPTTHDARTVEIYSPFQAIVISVYDDDGPIEDDGVTNQHITLQPVNYPSIQLEIFHTELTAELIIGSVVNAGDLLGWADFSRNGNTGSDFDFSVRVNSADGIKLVSLFDILTDSSFSEFVSWSGLSSREDFEISKSLRDSNPLQCANDSLSLYSGNFIDQDNDPIINLRWIEAQ